MNEPMRNAVLQRLDRLERQHRRWQLLGGSALALLGLAVLLGATGSKEIKALEEIRAKRFVLVDAHGAPRGGLHVGTDGKSRVILTDQMGTPHAVLFVEASGAPGLVLYDQAGGRRATFLVDTDHAPALVLTDGAGATRAKLFVRPEGSASLALYDQTGKLLWRAP